MEQLINKILEYGSIEFDNGKQYWTPDDKDFNFVITFNSRYKTKYQSGYICAKTIEEGLNKLLIGIETGKLNLRKLK